jgi:DNA-binding MarR family transcriptional regulator
MTADLAESAQKLLEVVPIIMQDIRSEMRNQRSADLTVSQFRAVACVNRKEGSSLWELAQHVGLTAPSTWRLVDGLIECGLMTRKDPPVDRRRVELTVIDQGSAILEASAEGTMSYLASKLSGVDVEKSEAIDRAVEKLRAVFLAGA